MLLRFSRTAALCLTACLVLAAAAPAVAATPQWPQTGSDLVADPAVRFGVLPNGLRYAIMHNETPKGQVAMRVQIQAGSMYEGPGQEGLAHFVEHMAFRGTTHVPDGQMVQSLQRLGLQFGADTNATTGQIFTTYMFNLPRSDDASVGTGLDLLREIASEIRLDAEIAKTERGVIQAEERTRAGEQLDAARAQAKLVYGDHPYGRDTIGSSQVIAAADVAAMRAFYDAYYRPERAVLTVVGDIDPDVVESRIRDQFAGWTGKGPAGPDPQVLSPAGRAAQFVALDGKPLISQLSLTWIKPYEPQADSQALLQDRLIRWTAQSAISARLSVLAQAAGQPFAAAKMAENIVPGVSLTVSAQAALINDWRASLDLLVKARSQILAYGFSQDEVDQALTRIKASYKAAADGAGTRQSSTLANDLLDSAAGARVFRTRAEVSADVDRFADQITLAQLNAGAAELLAGEGPLVFLSAPGAPEADVGVLRSAYEVAAAAPVEPVVQAAVKPWTYTDFGAPGTVVARQDYADLGITQVRFANGVRLLVRPSSAAQNQINVRVRFGHGQAQLPDDQPGMSTAAGLVLNTGGVEGYARTELAKTLAGKTVGVTFAIGEAEFVASGSTQPDDLATQLQLMAASFVHPGWQPGLYASTRDMSLNLLSALLDNPAVAYAFRAEFLLHDEDPRWLAPTADQIAAVSADDARAFIAPIRASAPLEVLIAGDTTAQVAIAEVAKTFGALPARSAVALAPLRPVSFPAPTAEPVIITHPGRADQAIAGIAWPTTDARNGAKDALIGDVLATIMRSRLIETLRAHDGKAYSPGVSASFSPRFEGYGYIQVQAAVAPVDIDAFYTTVRALAADLAANPVSADELARAVKPMEEAYARSRQSNAYWLSWMGRIGDAPWVPDHLRHISSQFGAITPGEVQAAARRWLSPATAWEARAVAAATP